MAEVLFSSFAESDIEDIFVYYAEYNVNSSRKFISELMQSLNFWRIIRNSDAHRTIYCSIFAVFLIKITRYFIFQSKTA